ncbi:Smr/MutS family protein [Methylobacterium nigriterrae]|uniref:Smr/MutS family protein n=1 Tax=Methylobacterium nigriterrae TaxID=3127512 RepID=UPI0030141B94
MRRPRRPRLLSGEEARLWAEIARLVTPLRGRAHPAPGPETPPAKPTTKPTTKPAAGLPVSAAVAKPPPKRVKAATPPTAAPYQAPRPAPSPPAGLERRARLGLRRGSLPIEARIDLHGLVQAEAHAALVGFLMRARAAGHAHVLVVTGKGGAGLGGAGLGGSGFDDAFSERGVLRRSVPHWLRSPELRPVVLGFEEAARHHGGGGALYVRLRRR